MLKKLLSKSNCLQSNKQSVKQLRPAVKRSELLRFGAILSLGGISLLSPSLFAQIRATPIEISELRALCLEETGEHRFELRVENIQKNGEYFTGVVVESFLFRGEDRLKGAPLSCEFKIYRGAGVIPSYELRLRQGGGRKGLCNAGGAEITFEVENAKESVLLGGGYKAEIREFDVPGAPSFPLVCQIGFNSAF